MTQLSKHSENNLRVIQNFLLYANMENELGQTAIDYISEDHVDGEDSEEAIADHAEMEAIENARKILCEDSDGSNDIIGNIRTQVKLIVEACIVNPDQMIDYVDDVIVWEKVGLEFTCQEFLDEIGWSE